eukprot:1131480-Pyramimonas_sp.AAC.1
MPSDCARTVQHFSLSYTRPGSARTASSESQDEGDKSPSIRWQEIVGKAQQTGLLLFQCVRSSKDKHRLRTCLGPEVGSL